MKGLKNKFRQLCYIIAFAYFIYCFKVVVKHIIFLLLERHFGFFFFNKCYNVTKLLTILSTYLEFGIGHVTRTYPNPFRPARRGLFSLLVVFIWGWLSWFRFWIHFVLNFCYLKFGFTIFHKKDHIYFFRTETIYQTVNEFFFST